METSFTAAATEAPAYPSARFLPGVSHTVDLLHAIRRTTTRADPFRICAEHLDHREPVALEPIGIG